MMNEMAIIITAFNRPKALSNLLKSLSGIRCDSQISLIISIEYGGTDEVYRIANDFKWIHGEKIIIEHKQKLGLRNHFIWVGNQTQKYKNVIFLEDDLIVSPELLNFADASISYYASDDNVAGLCLYNPILCEFNGSKFYQNQDGYDVYFLQHPYWGNIWMKDKWMEFKDWLKNYEPNYSILPQQVSNWKDTSFKKVFIQYLIETKKYIVVPRVSIVSNNGEIGLHNSAGLYQYQVVLMNERINYRFCNCNQSKAVYDAFMEIVPGILKQYNPSLKEYDFEVDLQGNRHTYSKEYVLTTRPTKNKVMSFSSLMKPMENGVIYSAPGDGIILSRSNDVCVEKKYDRRKLYVDIDKNYIVSVSTIMYFIKRKIIDRLMGMFV